LGLVGVRLNAINLSWVVEKVNKYIWISLSYILKNNRLTMSYNVLQFYLSRQKYRRTLSYIKMYYNCQGIFIVIHCLTLKCITIVKEYLL